ncbi:hypothetical protein [Paenibacillus taichungensis]
MDKKLAEHLMTAETEMGRAYRNYILDGLTEQQIDEALGLNEEVDECLSDPKTYEHVIHLMYMYGDYLKTIGKTEDAFTFVKNEIQQNYQDTVELGNQIESLSHLSLFNQTIETYLTNNGQTELLNYLRDENSNV